MRARIRNLEVRMERRERRGGRVSLNPAPTSRPITTSRLSHSRTHNTPQFEETIFQRVLDRLLPPEAGEGGWAAVAEPAERRE
jgi:hypothetical protein